jgi:hypothetical protein
MASSQVAEREKGRDPFLHAKQKISDPLIMATLLFGQRWEASRQGIMQGDAGGGRGHAGPPMISADAPARERDPWVRSSGACEQEQPSTEVSG